jgi:hypothetical protein
MWGRYSVAHDVAHLLVVIGKGEKLEIPIGLYGEVGVRYALQKIEIKSNLGDGCSVRRTPLSIP